MRRTLSRSPLGRMSYGKATIQGQRLFWKVTNLRRYGNEEDHDTGDYIGTDGLGDGSHFCNGGGTLWRLLHGGLSQSFKQETESGDVDQSFEVSCGGDNAKQCVNVSGASNTGNVQDASPALSRSTLPSTNSSRRTLAPTLQLMADPM